MTETNQEQLNVTIVIPARSYDFLLEECLQNIRKLYPVVSIILVLDDISKIPELDTNTKVLKSINKYMSAKRNQGVKEAKTEYIAFIDSDAYPDKKWLEQAVDFLSKNDNYAAVTGNQLLPPNDDLSKQCLRLVRFCRIFTYPKWCKVIDLNAVEQDCEEFMTSNVIMRISAFYAVNGMNENLYLAEDNDFSQRLVESGLKIRFIPKIRVYHHECAIKAFMRKICCMSYYYSEEFRTDIHSKSFKEFFSIFFPLGVVALTVFLYCLGIYLGENVLLLLNFPLFIGLLFLYEANNLAQKLKDNKIKGYFLILWIFILFCCVWLIGTLCGLLGIKILDVQKSYRHY